jgi:hypothetical protein
MLSLSWCRQEDSNEGYHLISVHTDSTKFLVTRTLPRGRAPVLQHFAGIAMAGVVAFIAARPVGMLAAVVRSRQVWRA